MRKTFRARIKAFRGYGVETIMVSVDDDGAVRVWDDVAHHYTLAHSVSRSTQARLRARAARMPDGARTAERSDYDV